MTSTAGPSKKRKRNPKEVDYTSINLPEDFNINGVLRYTALDSLRGILQEAEIDCFAEIASDKNCLAGMVVLYNLDLLKKGETVHEEFAIEVGRLSLSSKYSLQKIVDTEELDGVDKHTSKSSILKILIQKRLADGAVPVDSDRAEAIRKKIVEKEKLDAEREKEIAGREQRVAERKAKREAEMKDRVKSRTKFKTIDKTDPKDLSYQLVNLLLSMVYYDLFTTKSLDLLPDCPVSDIEEAKKILQRIPMLENQEDLTDRLEILKTKSAEKQVLLWICSTFGHELSFLEGDKRIPGFPPEIHQFFIQTPNDVLQLEFEDRLAANNMTSQLRFHGTPLRNLRSILQTGFCGYVINNEEDEEDVARGARYLSTYAGIWSASQPAHSHVYTAKETAWYLRQTTVDTTFPGNPAYVKVADGLPYRSCDYGALLACEHATKKAAVEMNFPERRAHSLMPRYIFLVPAGFTPYRTSAPQEPNEYPQRDQIETAIREGFAKFRVEEEIVGDDD